MEGCKQEILGLGLQLQLWRWWVTLRSIIYFRSGIRFPTGLKSKYKEEKRVRTLSFWPEQLDGWPMSCAPEGRLRGAI